jgi:ribonuclease HI
MEAEVYAIKVCMIENLDRDRNVCILADSQAPIKALENCHITSKLVCVGHQSLMELAEHKRVQLIWVPVHEDIHGIETADQLANRNLNICS